MYDDDEDYNSVTFAYRSHVDGVRRESTHTVKDKESYHDIIQQFVYFLNSIGYNYIEGITVHGPNGKDMYTTDM